MTTPPAISDDGRPWGQARRQREQRRRRIAWSVSAAIHGVLSAAVAAEVLLAVLFVVPVGEVRTIDLRSTGEPLALEASLATLPVEFPSDPTAAAVTEEQIAALAAQCVDPDITAELLDPARPAGDSLAARWVQARVASEIAAAEEASQEDQFRRLERLTGTLNDVASDQSVKEATARLSQLLNTKPRATEPAAEPPPGEFDVNTAQLYDVKRSDNGRGGYDYVAVLLDAEGRTLDSALTEAEGQQLFRTFELMKANPLLAQVYRGVVMSLLDKLLRPTTGGSPQP